MAGDRVYDVLFLCTGNSARSIAAECLLRAASEAGRTGAPRFRAHSAGSLPRSAPDPMVLEELERLNVDTRGVRSKSWDEFAGEGAPALDFVFTVCDGARGETCPVWPGQPMTAHWGLEDPHALPDDDPKRRERVRQVIRELQNRIRVFTSLPLETLDGMSLQRQLDEIGKTELPS